MNDPNKAISVNLSSLLSLKAELQRKQEEVRLAKSSKPTSTEFKPSKVISDKGKTSYNGTKKDSNYKEISRHEDAKVFETEDVGQLEKSRRVLEAKSKFYDRMSRSGGSLNSDDNCLVMFNRKRQEQHDDEQQPEQSCTQRNRMSSSSSSDSNNGDDDDLKDADNDDDEVEYVDCLGRTRKCLRKDLEKAKREDKQLADSMPERLDQTKPNWMIDTKGKHDSDNGSDDGEIFGPRPTESVYSEALSTMTKHDEQRLNWERKEQENFDKPDVHYQDVFFDEARTHGVGYYAFSTDEDERRQQQRELEKSRNATQAEQKRRDELKAQRDKMIAERVFAAKNRIRARSGLPPISIEEYEREQQEKAEAAKEAAQREQELSKKDKKRIAQKAVEEAEREELRKEHIRDWDREKDGVAKSWDEEQPILEEWQYKPERLPMSQEQWNEQQRAIRAPEFAPMPEVMPKRTNFSSMPPPSSMWRRDEQEFINFHSSRREKQFQRRNYTNATDDNDDEESPASSTSPHSHGAAIPPPASLDADFSGPSSAKQPKSQADLERSIEAGLRFLRDNCDKGVLGNKATWTAKADY